MAAISETLRQARLRSGVDIDKLAAKTKINPRYLEAIESGNFERLPSGIFARMFIKQYADAVGLDGNTFADEFQRSPQFGHYSKSDGGKGVDSRHNFHPTVPSMSSFDDSHRDRVTRMLSSLIWVVAAILVCAGAYYLLAHLPSRHTEASTPPVKTAPAQPASQPVPQPAPATATAPAPAAQPPSATPPSPEAPPIQLTLTAVEPVWVTAIADGKTVVAEELPAGSSKSVAATKGARITLGNAGGVEIVFNGKKLEPFGPRGQVRTVDFTSWGAQVVSRTPVSTTDPLDR